MVASIQVNRGQPVRIEFIKQAVLGSPVATVAYADFTGHISLDILTKVAILVYPVVQTAYLIWKWRREAKQKGQENGQDKIR